MSSEFTATHRKILEKFARYDTALARAITAALRDLDNRPPPDSRRRLANATRLADLSGDDGVCPQCGWHPKRPTA